MTKSVQRNITPEALKLVAARFKVLAEPLRLRILHELEEGEMSVSEVAEAVGATQPNVSKHLKMLQDAGLLFRQQNGNTVYYSVSDKTIFELCNAVSTSLRERLSAQANAFIDTRSVKTRVKVENGKKKFKQFKI
jgi:DNA-binding transcriptional ArsR family regulator